jgi:hypothetical protein
MEGEAEGFVGLTKTCSLGGGHDPLCARSTHQLCSCSCSLPLSITLVSIEQRFDENEDGPFT